MGTAMTTFFFSVFQIPDGDFGAGDGRMIEGIQSHLIHDAVVGRIDQAVRINESKTLQVKKLLNIPLISAHVIKIVQVSRLDHPDGDIDHIDIIL